MLTFNTKLANLTMLFLIFVSFFGLTLVAVLVLNPPEVQGNYVLRKPLAGSTLSVVCVLGIFAVLYPDTCAGLIGFRKRGETVHSFAASRVKVLRGHHAACKLYSTHVIKIRNRVLCASCSGLLVGAVITLVGIGLFFFWDLYVSENPFLPVLVGTVGVAVGLFYPFVPVRFQRGFTRFSAGALLAIGSFLILVGVDEATKNLSIDLFVAALSVLWLATKMSLSQWEHRRICTRCSLDACDAATAS